jgi:hypothetical protein
MLKFIKSQIPKLDITNVIGQGVKVVTSIVATGAIASAVIVSFPTAVVVAALTAAVVTAAFVAILTLCLTVRVMLQIGKKVQRRADAFIEEKFPDEYDRKILSQKNHNKQLTK